jgi:hypothetical protein
VPAVASAQKWSANLSLTATRSSLWSAAQQWPLGRKSHTDLSMGNTRITGVGPRRGLCRCGARSMLPIVCATPRGRAVHEVHAVRGPGMRSGDSVASENTFSKQATPGAETIRSTHDGRRTSW